MASVEGFFTYEIRVGTVTRAEVFPEARVPAYKMWIDLGPELGEKSSSARITHLYRPDDLIGRQVVCVTNFPPRRVGPFTSEVLVLGVETDRGVVLLAVDEPVPPGSRIS
ncbi:MAG TPA: tRNA-binding protein [Actinomycetota bacterium]|nr:tRNA-binding protein [Actinomycetota bacterium]